MNHNEGQYDVGLSIRQNEISSSSPHSFWKWQQPPSREEQIASTSKPIHVYNHEVSSKIKSSIPSFRIEYGILISELLQNCNLRLEELKLSENRTECSVWKENGTLQTFVIEKNKNTPLEYSVNYSVGNKEVDDDIISSPIETRSVSHTKQNIGAFVLVYEGLSQKKEKHQEEIKNGFTKSLSGGDPEEQRKMDTGSSFKLINPNYAPYPKHIQLSCNAMYNDLSFYEETIQFQKGDVTTVERFQRYKIKPKMKSSQGENDYEYIIAGDQEDTQISPRVPMSGWRSEENLKQHVQTKLKTLPSGNKVKNIFGSEPFSGYKPTTTLGTPKKHSLRNYNMKCSPRKDVSRPFLLPHAFKSTIPLIKFTKPQRRYTPINGIKRYIFPSRGKVKGSIGNFKTTLSKEVSNDGRLFRSEAWRSLNGCKNNEMPFAIVNKQKRLFCRKENSDKEKMAASERKIVDCLTKENTNHHEIFFSNPETVKEELNEKHFIYGKTVSPHVPSSPSNWRVLAESSTVENEFKTYLRNSLHSKYELDSKKELDSKQLETPNVIDNSVTHINTQKAIVRTSVKSCIEANIYDYKVDQKSSSDALSDEEKVHSPITSENQEPNESISEVSALLPPSNTREAVDETGPLSKVKDQEHSRLKHKVDKINLTSNDVQLGTLELKLPQICLTSSKHTEAPEVSRHNQKVELKKEPYIQKYERENLIFSNTTGKLYNSSKCQMEDGENRFHAQIHEENKLKKIPNMNTKEISKEVHDEEKDNEQCCLM